MKHNLETLTVNFTQAELSRVKKELQGIKKAVDEFKHNRNYMDGRSETIKEILGE